ncbi:hypothetical protein O181_006597 [Austropuccinia psidii MF-1]|uniref:Chromo domain-containing protein n=1 Tax=Austropuccinia psidii MF-1 TaxID=1389203 RepID=A0A9Q3BKB7_9BASI|nr:hypothetical protein [Austropuccinia psidii MF-1]
MTIFHKDGNIQKNADGLSRWPLPNNIDNPAYFPEESFPQIPIEGISVTDLNNTFFKEVRNSYTQDKNCSMLCQLLTKDCKDNSLIHSLDEIWKKAYDEGRFHLLNVCIFKGILDKARKHSIRYLGDSFAYFKDKWDKSHATPDFKGIHGENAIEVELSEELSNSHPRFPVSLGEPYKSSDAENFPLQKKVPQHIPPIESSGTRRITKVLKERKLRTKTVREYLIWYSDPTCKYKWLAEKDIPEATKLLRRFRNTINNNITK